MNVFSFVLCIILGVLVVWMTIDTIFYIKKKRKAKKEEEKDNNTD